MFGWQLPMKVGPPAAPGANFISTPVMDAGFVMHEVTLMSEAVRMALVTAQIAGGQRVSVLRLRVGKLSSAEPSALRFAFDVVCRGTPAEGARLEIEPIPAVGWCPTCRAEFAGADFVNECPVCHNVSGELRRGRELEIASVEIN